MENQPAENVPAVKRFVREVIGCDCPDEVFSEVRIRRGSSAIQACATDCELRIGGRLTVVVTSEPTALSDSILAQALAEGRRARDDAGFNRLRLVVRSPAIEEPWLSAAFQSAPARDDRTHLHVVGEVPDFFQQGAETGAR